MEQDAKYKPGINKIMILMISIVFLTFMGFFVYTSYFDIWEAGFNDSPILSNFGYFCTMILILIEFLITIIILKKNKNAFCTNPLTKKQLIILLILFFILFTLIELCFLPWITGFEIKFEGQSIPIHLGNHPVWNPPTKLEILNKEFNAHPRIDIEEFLDHLRIGFFTFLLIVIIGHSSSSSWVKLEI